MYLLRKGEGGGEGEGEGEEDYATGAITQKSLALLFGDDTVLLSALHAVEYANGQLIRLLGGNTKTLYIKALVRPRTQRAVMPFSM